MKNIGLLSSSSLPDFRIKTLTPILADKNFLIKVAIIDNRPKLTLKQKLKNNLKRGRGGYIIIMAFQRFFSQKTNDISTIQFCKDNDIEVIETNNPYSQETIDKIKKYNLDLLILVGGFGIIKKILLDVTPLGVLSYHHGNMRKYRGMPPALWELYNNESEMGVTVQVLSPGLDNGLPIEEKEIIIDKKDTVETLLNRALDESVDMLHKALIKLYTENYKPQKIEKFGKVYTLPNLKQYVILNLKLLFRRLI